MQASNEHAATVKKTSTCSATHGHEGVGADDNMCQLQQASSFGESVLYQTAVCSETHFRSKRAVSSEKPDYETDYTDSRVKIAVSCTKQTDTNYGEVSNNGHSGASDVSLTSIDAAFQRLASALHERFDLPGLRY